MEKGLLDKTGKSLDHWIKVVHKENLIKHSEIIKLLKSKHSFTHGYANFVALKALSSDAASNDPNMLVKLQYKGDKQHLFEIYKKLVEVTTSFGKDVEIVPKKANVSIRSKRQWALIQPSTSKRIDLGLKFDQMPLTQRLENSGPFGSMCTHRVVLTSKYDVDEELIGWLSTAYEQGK